MIEPMRGGEGGGERERKKKSKTRKRLEREECLVGVKDKNNERAAKNISREGNQYEIEKRMASLKIHNQNEKTDSLSHKEREEKNNKFGTEFTWQV